MLNIVLQMLVELLMKSYLPLLSSAPLRFLDPRFCACDLCRGTQQRPLASYFLAPPRKREGHVFKMVLLPLSSFPVCRGVWVHVFLFGCGCVGGFERVGDGVHSAAGSAVLSVTGRLTMYGVGVDALISVGANVVYRLFASHRVHVEKCVTPGCGPVLSPVSGGGDK